MLALSNDKINTIDTTDIKENIKVLSSIVSVQKKDTMSASEEVLYSLMKRMLDTSRGIMFNITYFPEIAISTWRTAYEISVLFNIMTQPVIVKGDIKLFNKIVSRYIDYGDIVESNALQYRNDYVKKNLIRKYRELPNNETLDRDYDWANPIFTKNEFNKMNAIYHPSFRDLAEKTTETTSNLQRLIPNYKLSSNLIHQNNASQKITQEISIDELEHITNVSLRSVIGDFANLMISMNKLAGNNVDGLLDWQRSYI